MIADACAKADADVDFSQYDWNGDGRVEQIYVLYAGLGEAAGGASTTIWPHECSLSSSDYGTQYVTNDGETFVDTYSC
jgi:M6 family metalloprotease-like protein